MALTYGADAFSGQRLSERRQPSASHPRHSRRRPVRQVSSKGKDMPRRTLRAQGHPCVAAITCLRHEHRVGHLRFQACDAHTDVLLANAASPNSPSHLNVLRKILPARHRHCTRASLFLNASPGRHKGWPGGGPFQRPE